MAIKRQTMKFLVPISVFGIKSNTLSGRELIPCYINPQSFKISESKLLRKTFTKGGYYIEYWGEELPKISVSGITGSGGIEAIEILRSIYRNEQIQMEELLLNRASQISSQSSSALNNTNSLPSGALTAIDTLFGNAASEIINGTASIIDKITDIFDGEEAEQPEPVTLIPSLGTFAVAIDLYMQGIKYRGFFTRFDFGESADSAGHFDYSFEFEVLRISGKRRNFMPWHRSPYDSSGKAIEASIPTSGSMIQELSYPVDLSTYNSIANVSATSEFSESQNTPIQDLNDIGINRLEKLKKG